jgi:hypothetical protein
VGADAGRNLRNALIVVGLAAVVWLLPGGEAGSQTIGNLLSVILLGGLCFFAYRSYMENRIMLLDLASRPRAILYGSLATITFAIVATGRLTGQGGVGVLVWMGLIGLAAYGMYFVYRTAREY